MPLASGEAPPHLAMKQGNRSLGTNTRVPNGLWIPETELPSDITSHRGNNHFTDSV
jgi:hypothetical protein